MENLCSKDLWSVVQPAQNDPNDDCSVPSEEAEANYISREFLNVWGQHGKSVISVPKTFPTSEDPTDGELAEKALFDILKEAGSNDQDLRLIIFNGLRSTEADDSTAGLKQIREMDSGVFLGYKKKKGISFMEVKCCKEEKGLKGHRKKAANQLNKVKYSQTFQSNYHRKLLLSEYVNRL